MANITVTPNMSLPNPIPGVDPGPDYAQNIQSSFNIVDQHNHSPGSGVQINPSGININADLTWNNTNNATNLRSLRFNAQASPLATVADVGCLYESGVDLYYNDGAGNQVRITQSGNVTGASGTITGLPSGTASAAFSSGSGTFIFQQATSTAANLDVGSIAIRYPGSYPTPSGNYIQLQAPTSLATGYSLTLPPGPPGASGVFLTSTTSGIISYTNTDNSTLTISGGVLIVKNHGITASQIADATITGTQVSSNINLPGKAVQAESRDVVVSGTNPGSNCLQIIRGVVSNTGTIVSGEGFAVTHTANTGLYTLSFNFLDTPALIAQRIGNFSPGYVSTATSASAGTIYTMNTSGTPIDEDFSFIAIGQRT